jgi:iron complex outermembrane receptor protein
VLQLGKLDITLDAYRIDIDDRIVLSENLTQDAVRNYLIGQGFEGVGGGRFFINGVDTRTEGVDLVIHYPLDTASIGRFDLMLAGNVNSTDVTRVPQTPQIAAINPAPRVFDRINVLTLEEGTPKNKYTAAVNWSLPRLGASVRATRYGDVLFPGTVAANDLVLTAKTLLDMEVRIDVTESVRATIGADNVLDKYSNELPPRLNGTGTQSFSNYSPFGRSGRFVFGKASYRF